MGLAQGSGMKLIREYVREILEEATRGSHPNESYPESTIKSLYLDRPTSHGGWPEGPSKSFTSNKPVNVQISDWLKSMGLAK